MIAPSDLFELEGLTHAALFDGVDQVWDALDRIKDFCREWNQRHGAHGALLRRGGDMLAATVVLHQGVVHDSGFELLGGDPTKGLMRVRLAGREVDDAAVINAGAVITDDLVHIAPGAVIESGALLKGPTVIGPGSEVRQGAYLRGACLVGRGCVVGHTTEMKNAMMLDEAKAGHFAYLGDSILGREVNLGAGTKLANLKIINHPFVIRAGEVVYKIARRKFGAIMGDHAETGCNSVTNPGTILGPRCLVAPCVSVRGDYHPPRSVIR